MRVLVIASHSPLIPQPSSKTLHTQRMPTSIIARKSDNNCPSDAKAYLVQSPEYAAKDRPELGIDTDNIDEIFKETSSRSPRLLHPNSNTVSLKPWGAREFAMLDKTTVCVNFREWPATG